MGGIRFQPAKGRCVCEAQAKHMRTEPFKEALGSDRGHQGGVVYPQCVVSLTGTN